MICCHQQGRQPVETRRKKIKHIDGTLARKTVQNRSRDHGHHNLGHSVDRQTDGIEKGRPRIVQHHETGRKARQRIAKHRNNGAYRYDRKIVCPQFLRFH